MVKNKHQQLLEAIASVIQDKKGVNIIGIDVRSFSSLTNYFLVAQGTVPRHVTTLARKVIELLSEQGIHPLYTEGLTHGDWIVLDYGDFIVHLMQEDMREKYRLEEMWKAGKIVDLHLKSLKGFL